MPNIGNLNNMVVTDVLPFGYSLSETATKESTEMVFMPVSDATAELTEGQSIEAYVYYAQDGSMHATQKDTAIKMGEFALLTCTGVTDFGAFFDYGVGRDLLVPKSMQHKPMDEGLSYVVCLLHDEQNRKLIGCSKLHRYLEETTDELSVGQAVDALVFDETSLGFKCVVNKQFQGLLFKSDLFKNLSIGNEIKVFIKHIREDGKIDLSLQKQGEVGRNDLAADIIEDLVAHGGISTLTDKSSADEIFARYNVSKGAYKRAIGTLYKNKKIMLSKTHISLVENK
ncbi:MAG: putative RNA-binding protein (virulence factor B family) [Glaciecola sp.]|jgi:predicted RNA-binding protein (virulence factor B family)